MHDPRFLLVEVKLFTKRFLTKQNTVCVLMWTGATALTKQPVQAALSLLLLLARTRAVTDNAALMPLNSGSYQQECSSEQGR